MKVEALYDRGRRNWIATRFLPKQRQVAGGFLAADSFDATFKRKVNRNFFQPAQPRGTPIERDARQLANSDLRILQRRGLRIQTQIKAVSVIVFVEENLRTFFRRDRLLDRIGENLAKCEAGSDVHISRRQKAVGEIVHRVDVETRTTLVGIRGAGLWPEDAILNEIKP